MRCTEAGTIKSCSWPAAEAGRSKGWCPGLMSPLPSMIRQWFPMFPTNSMGSGCTRLFLVVPGFFSSWYCKTKLGINMPWVCMNCTVQKPGWPLHELTYLIRFPQTILWIITSALRNTSTFTVLYTEQAMKQWNWWWIAPSSTIPREASSPIFLWILWIILGLRHLRHKEDQPWPSKAGHSRAEPHHSSPSSGSP